ncbi:MAG: SDR family NAD(P)-dependent oxidoreductase [Verrucomicrobiota bacterium]|nr:SDR family NAD(P)-dependent oxidoreductase [Verrucomicrobiota bacterium]
MKIFKDKIVIVSGGTRGIGKGIAEAFLREGAEVLVTYVGNTERAEAFSKENEAYSKRLHLFCFDISDYKQVEEFFDAVSDKFDKIDILVNNAGIRDDAIVGMMSEESWKKVLDINLTGNFYMSKFAVQLMSRKRYGRIINITSAGWRAGFGGQANYSASKAGQVGFTRSLSKEVAKRKITVNCVSPGFIDTGFIDDLPEDLLKEYKKSIPLKRFGSIEEVADGVLFLASDKASYITGTVLEITGGI